MNESFSKSLLTYSTDITQKKDSYMNWASILHEQIIKQFTDCELTVNQPIYNPCTGHHWLVNESFSDLIKWFIEKIQIKWKICSWIVNHWPNHQTNHCELNQPNIWKDLNQKNNLFTHWTSLLGEQIIQWFSVNLSDSLKRSYSDNALLKCIK